MKRTLALVLTLVFTAGLALGALAATVNPSVQQKVMIPGLKAVVTAKLTVYCVRDDANTPNYPIKSKVYVRDASNNKLVASATTSTGMQKATFSNLKAHNNYNVNAVSVEKLNMKEYVGYLTIKNIEAHSIKYLHLAPAPIVE